MYTPLSPYHTIPIQYHTIPITKVTNESNDDVNQNQYSRIHSLAYTYKSSAITKPQ